MRAGDAFGNTSEGSEAGRDARFTEVYTQLRTIARRERRRNPNISLNTTAIVHEAWLKLCEQESGWSSREHYLGTAAMAMRHLLVDYARFRTAGKRDARREIPLAEAVGLPPVGTAHELLAIDDALDKLAALNERQARLVMLRFFAGLDMAEAARCLDISPSTATRDWVKARAYLKVALKK